VGVYSRLSYVLYAWEEVVHVYMNKNVIYGLFLETEGTFNGLGT
jgi:hypothetical protein